MQRFCLLLIAASVAGAAVAQDFAPAGAKATLSVQYRYTSNGKLTGNGSSVYQLHEWNATRSVEMTADLVAAKPLAMPSLQAPDDAAVASMQRQGAQVRKTQEQMAPMMAGAEQIVARCGNDEKCIEREVQKMGAAMAGTPQVAQASAAGRETAAAMQPGATRHQAWRAVAQKGRYAIDGTEHIVHADPACLVLPTKRCTRDTTSKGAGDVPAVPGGRGGPAAAEFDAQAQTITLVLPVPIGVLPYTDTVTTNEPNPAPEVTPGPHARPLRFVTTADGKVGAERPVTVALKGAWRSQTGEQVVQVKGDGAEGGTLTIRWRFSVQ